MKAYVPSGSDTATTKKLRKTSFRFFERMQFLEVALATETTISSLPFETTSLPSTSDSNFLFDSSCSESVINLDVSSSKTSHQLTSPKITLNEPISAPLPSNTVASSKANSSRASKNKRKHFDRTEQNDVQESLLEALRQPLKEPDAVDGILLR
ncbi:unnamed protein product [Lasius platythorax]